MILKIELVEKISTIYSSNLSINLVNKNVSYMKGDTVLKNENCNISQNDLSNILKNYITYWKREYIDSSIIDGRTVELTIFTDKEVLTYLFKNSFPDDLEEFIKVLKEKVNVHD